MKTCVLLFSGGVDSTSTLDMLIKDNFNVYPLYIDYGQKAIKSELKAVKYFIKKYNTNPLKIVKTNTYKDIKNHPLLNLDKELDVASADRTTSKNFLHFRNLTFACIAAIYSREVNAENIAFGFINKSNFNSFPDTSPDFLKKLNDLLNIIEPDFSIKIIAPCISLSKREIVKKGIFNKIPLNQTYSCYEGKRCFKCESCLDVITAFDELSLEINIKDLKKYNPYKLITK